MSFEQELRTSAASTTITSRYLGKLNRILIFKLIFVIDMDFHHDIVSLSFSIAHASLSLWSYSAVPVLCFSFCLISYLLRDYREYMLFVCYLSYNRPHSVFQLEQLHICVMVYVLYISLAFIWTRSWLDLGFVLDSTAVVLTTAPVLTFQFQSVTLQNVEQFMGAEYLCMVLHLMSWKTLANQRHLCTVDLFYFILLPVIIYRRETTRTRMKSSFHFL